MLGLLPAPPPTHPNEISPAGVPVIKKQTNFLHSSLRKTTHLPNPPWQTKLISLPEMRGLPALTLCSAQPCAKTASWCSKDDPAKSWRCQLPRLESMVMPRYTLLELIFSLAKNMKIFALLLTTWMFQILREMIINSYAFRMGTSPC